MRVLIDNDVIANAIRSDVLSLHELLMHVCRGRHHLIGDMEPWFATLDVPTATAYRKALQLSVRAAGTVVKNAATVHVKLSASNSWTDPTAELSMGDALRLLREPLGIIVENSNNDWNFLLGLSTQLGRQTLDRGVSEGWIKVLHGGGADIVPIIVARSQLKHEILRTFALFDSDRHHPEELLDNWTPPKGTTCQGFITESAAKQHLSNRYWRLERRFIESYVPKAELEKHEANNSHVPTGATSVFFKMPETSRWYFDIKKGFNSDSKNSAVTRQRGLFSNVSAEDRKALAVGFGRPSSQYTEAKNLGWDSAALAEAGAHLPKILRLI